jgi:predicted dehydrogenase/threonine dehydrogenase-like Zn-dependent dehydrogenase
MASGMELIGRFRISPRPRSTRQLGGRESAADRSPVHYLCPRARHSRDRGILLPPSLEGAVKQVVQHIGSGDLELAEVPEPACKSGGIVVRNAASLISAGTEKMVIDFAGKSLLGKAQERPDLVKKVLSKVRKEGISATIRTVTAGLRQAMPLGYSCAGIVEQVGREAEEFSVGQRVACAGMGYASHADVVFVPRNLSVAVPDVVSFEDASYVTLGAIALQGVRIAAPTMGEWVAVIGLGLLGQLTVQLLKAAGCQVIGIDIDPSKVTAALKLGADVAVARTDDVHGAVAAATDGIGVDAVIVTAATDSNDPIELAGDICRERGRVSMVGAVKMEIPRKVYYMKELELRLSRSYGPGRYDPAYEEGGRDYPIAYVRWTERRNMQEFLRLVAAGAVTPSALTTHRFPIGSAAKAYDIVLGRDKVAFSGVILQYPTANGASPLRTVEIAPRKKPADVAGIGFIGGGSFANAVLLPRFADRRDVALIGIATARGMNATNVARRYRFGYATTDTNRLLEDSSIDAIVIVTRHGSHPRFAAEVLRAGKGVFVEKPLAIDEEGLDEVISAQATSGRLLAVGFNRRFSPLAEKMKSAFPAGTRLSMTYRINAGAIPREAWVHDPAEGGGRIIGEVCHFIDFMQYLTDDVPSEVFAYSVGGVEGALHDTVSVTIRFSRGSIGSVNYFATGDSSVAKENVEVFAAGTVAQLQDFRELTISRAGKQHRTKLGSQDKGFAREVGAFVAAVRGAGAPPIAIESLIATTRSTFAIEESLRTGQPVAVRVARSAS